MFLPNERTNQLQIFLILVSNRSHGLDVSTNLNQEFSAAPFYSIMLNSVCRHLSRPPSVPLHLSLCSLFLFLSLGWSRKKMKAAGWSLSLSWARIQKHKEKERERGDKGRKKRREKRLSYWPCLIASHGGRGRGAEGYSEKTGAPCEEGEHRAAVKLAQLHEEKTTRALCVHVYVWSLEREAEGLKWRYGRQYGGHTQI